MQCPECGEQIRRGYNSSSTQSGLCYPCEIMRTHGVYMANPPDSRLRHVKGECGTCDHYRRVYGAR